MKPDLDRILYTKISFFTLHLREQMFHMGIMDIQIDESTNLFGKKPGNSSEQNR